MNSVMRPVPWIKKMLKGTYAYGVRSLIFNPGIKIKDLTLHSASLFPDRIKHPVSS